MPQNDFLPFATSGLANVISQAVYATASYLGIGRSSGVLPSNVYNKVSRQGSIAAYLLGQIINDNGGVDALDNGDTATLLANLKLALRLPTAGDVKPTFKIAADPGWLMMADQTMGSAASSATYANADAQNLFIVMYNNLLDAWAPILTSGGVATTRGAQGTAAAAWASNVRMTLPKALGRALASAGAGSGLSVRALGQNLGEEAHLQTLQEIAPHTHDASSGSFLESIADVGRYQPGAAGSFASLTGGVTGLGPQQKMNVMQPTFFANFMICK
jgi:hypothetical protein